MTRFTPLWLALTCAVMAGCMETAPVPTWVYLCQDTVQEVTACPPDDVGGGDAPGPIPEAP